MAMYICDMLNNIPELGCIRFVSFSFFLLDLSLVSFSFLIVQSTKLAAGQLMNARLEHFTK